MLRQVLGSKVRRATELKRNLGITPFKEFKQDLQSGIQQIKDSSTYVFFCQLLKQFSNNRVLSLAPVTQFFCIFYENNNTVVQVFNFSFVFFYG